MSRIVIRHSVNKDVNFIHVVNVLVSYKVMSLEEASCLYKKFKLAEDVAFDIQDEITSTVKDAFDSLNCKYE